MLVSLKRFISVYTPFVRNSFLAMLAYRLRYYTGIFTYVVFIAVHYYIWHAVFAAKEPGATINGFTLEQMVTYVAVGWLSRSLYFSDIDEDISELVRTGQVSMYLIRPVHFQTMMLAQALGGTLFRTLCFSGPLALVVYWIFPVALPASPLAALMFGFSTVIAFITFAQINFLVGLLSFSLKSINGIIRAKYYLLQFLSGLLLPLTFFPATVRVVLEYLPFQAITYLPLRFYLGEFDQAFLWRSVSLQLFWILVLFVVGRWMWRRAFVRLTVQGG